VIEHASVHRAVVSVRPFVALLPASVVIFIAHQHSNAEQDIHIVMLSVRLSVCLSRFRVVSNWLNISAYFYSAYGNSIIVEFPLLNIFAKFLKAALNTRWVYKFCDFLSTRHHPWCPIYLLPWETSSCEIYGCGGGLLMAFINVPYLLEIYCCYLVCAADARSVSDG